MWIETGARIYFVCKTGLCYVWWLRQARGRADSKHTDSDSHGFLAEISCKKLDLNIIPFIYRLTAKIGRHLCSQFELFIKHTKGKTQWRCNQIRQERNQNNSDLLRLSESHIRYIFCIEMLANDNVEPQQLGRHLESKQPENADKPLQFFPLMLQAT